MTTNRQWRLARRPTGMLSTDDFRLTEEEGPVPGDRQALIRNTWFPLEPAMRGWIADEPNYLPPVEIGAVMRGLAYGEVIESNDPGLVPGDRVTSFAGWQEYCIGDSMTQRVEEGLRPELVLSVLGMTGLTAYVGLLQIGRPEPGATVVVSAAAGATGSVAAQLARSRGCRVVGIAGGPEKCDWLRDEARLDAAIDYRNDDVAARLDEHCPDGIDVFFDNVGGEVLDLVFERLALHGCIVLCGAVVRFGDGGPAPGPANYWKMIQKRGRMEAFVVLDHLDRADEAAKELAALVQSGEMTYAVDVQTGFENLPETLRRVYTGANLGKQLLTVDGGVTR